MKPAKPYTPAPIGTWPVLFTPFHEDNTIDFEGLDALVDFYIEAGVGGLFSSCASSEIFSMNFDEMLATSRRVVERAKGRVGVVGSANNFGKTIEEQAEHLRRMYGVGVDAAVVLTSTLPSEEKWVEQMFDLAEMLDFPLGIYECPAPVHRTLTPEQVTGLAQTGSYIFMKETTRKVESIAPKVKAAEGSVMHVFPANCECMVEAILAGGKGHCGVVGNVCPELCSMLLDPALNESEMRRIHDSIMLIHQVMTKHCYPQSGKYILSKRGVPIGTTTRIGKPKGFTPDDAAAIDAFMEMVDFTKPLSKEELAVIGPVASPGWLD